MHKTTIEKTSMRIREMEGIKRKLCKCRFRYPPDLLEVIGEDLDKAIKILKVCIYDMRDRLK